MAVPVIMPRQGQSVESCVITKWNKKPGDPVKVGDVLFAYETDKAAFEEEAKLEGTLLGVFFQEGDDVPCLTNLCVIGSPGESFAEFDPNGGAASPAAATETQAAPAAATSAPTATNAEAAAPGAQSAPAPISGDLKISPRAQAMAEARHADLSKAAATGPDGRVIARDVQALLDRGQIVSPAAASAYQGGIDGTGLGGRVTVMDLEGPDGPTSVFLKPNTPATPLGAPYDGDSYEEPLTNMRKTIAKAMMSSLSSMAQLTHTASFDATEIQAARKLFKDRGAAQGMDRISLNDIILFAVSRTLAMPEHRALNANLLDGAKMKYFRTVNLGLAVDTERGLMVPVIFGAERMSLLQISQQAKRLAKECQGGTINPDHLRGGSFTISNLGAMGIESFTPVINPPQTGILGVNTITTRVREGCTNGQLETYPCMALSLTYDHRALDGAPASRFLRDLMQNLENFTLLLAKG